MTGRRPVVLVGVSAAVALGAAGPALAAWTAAGGAAAGASARTLAAPGTPTAGTVTSTSVPLSWTASAALPTGTTAYRVERTPSGATTWAAACTATHPTATGGTALSCTDSGFTAGTAYQYRVVAAYEIWRRTSATSATVTTTALSSLAITSPANGDLDVARNPTPSATGSANVGAGYGTTLSATITRGTTTVQTVTSVGVNQTTGAWSFAVSCLDKSVNYVLTVTQSTPTGSSSVTSSFKTRSANSNC